MMFGAFVWLVALGSIALMAFVLMHFAGFGVSYSYRVEKGNLVIRGVLFGGWTFWTKRVPIAELEVCRPFDLLRDLPGGWAWGVTLRPWWVLVFKERRVFGLRRVFISPTEAEAQAIAASIELTDATGQRTEPVGRE